MSEAEEMSGSEEMTEEEGYEEMSGSDEIDEEVEILIDICAAVDAIENRHYMTGSIGETVKITLEDDTTLNFPMSTNNVQEKMPSILKHAKTSAFGKGKKTVIDPAVRTATEIVPENFQLDLDVEKTGILAEIKRVLVPDAMAVTAELLKLNIYTKGGHFKKHKDTPRGETSFGSLVVVLPAPFYGGELGLSCNKKKTELKFNSPWSYGFGTRRDKPSVEELAEIPPNTLQWAAFFGDVDHWVTEVSDGTRFTLTYILYRDAAPDPNCDQLLCRATQLLDVLDTALQCSTFFPEGGALGYYCGHLYEESQLKASEDNMKFLNISATQLQLKNQDAVFAVVGSSLGLGVEMIRLLSGMYLDEQYILKAIPKKTVGFGYRGQLSLEDIENYQYTDGVLSERYEKIEWIGSKKAAEKEFADREYSDTGYFGNEASGMTLYTSAAVVLVIPAFADRANLAPTQLQASQLVAQVNQSTTSNNSKQPEVREKLKEVTNRVGALEEGKRGAGDTTPGTGRKKQKTGV